jgi:uncharacterized ferritin-like protein (DUF455 family)
MALPCPVTANPPPAGDTTARPRALQALRITDPPVKVAAVRALFGSLSPMAAIDAGALAPDGPVSPGRPARPRLVAPSQVPQRSAFTPHGRAALLHAVAHIEFNAIKMAACIVWRHLGALLRHGETAPKSNIKRSHDVRYLRTKWIATDHA